jgi:ESAT-6 family protein
MAGEVSVQREAINRAAGQLDQAYGVVTGLRTQLASHAQELQAAWRGEASSAFQNVYTSFDADLGKILTAMQQLHENMTSTHTTYNATEAQQTQTVSKVAGLLNNK